MIAWSLALFRVYFFSLKELQFPEEGSPTKSKKKNSSYLAIGEAKGGLLNAADKVAFVDALNAYANLLYNWRKLQVMSYVCVILSINTKLIY